jgi:hypothetical protein
MSAVLKRPAARLVKLKPIGAIIGSSAHFTNDRQSAAVAAAAVNRYIHNKKHIAARLTKLSGLHLSKLNKLCSIMQNEIREKRQ